MIRVVVACTLAVLLVAAAWSPRPVHADAVVGTGTAGSCTEAALDAALAGGGNVTFNCGGAATITVTSTKAISADTNIDGGSLITISGGNSVGVFAVNYRVNSTIQNLTIANGSAGYVGGIDNDGTLTVTNCTFSGNSAGYTGGGISNGNDGTLTVTNSTFSGNSAPNGGGGIDNRGTLTVTNCTFSGNSAGYVVGSTGGGIYNDGGTLTVTNSTFSGNSAGYVGGAIYNDGTLTVTNSTFFGNSAVGGGGIYSNGGTLTVVTNTIVANSRTGGNCGGAAVTDGGHNIDDGTTCGFAGTGCTSTSGSSFCSTNPVLDPTGLHNNGGPTQTIALEAGSPAVNAGNETVCADPPVNNLDQRGYTRPGLGATNCSVGAYEYNLPGACCQCATSCAAPINGSCAGCIAVFGATCESGDLCVLDTPTPTPTPTPPTPTPTKTPGASDCCQCADLCAAPIVGTCGGCTVVYGASCAGGSCITQTPTPTPTPMPTAQCSSISCGGSCTIPAPCTPSLGTACPNFVVLGECQADASGTCHCVPVQSPSPTVAVSNTPTSTPTVVCGGDCDANSHVTIDEILTTVNIALGNAPVDDCLAGDVNGDRQITVDEILTAVNNALNGCEGNGGNPGGRSGERRVSGLLGAIDQPANIATDIWTPGHRPTDRAAIVPQPLKRC